MPRSPLPPPRRDLLDWIKRGLAERGMLQIDLARRMGWTKGMCSSRLNGNTQLTADELLEIFDIFGMDSPISEPPSPAALLARHLPELDREKVQLLSDLLASLARTATPASNRSPERRSEPDARRVTE